METERGTARMFQKHSMMSLKKKSKSLGHLTALGSYPCSPDVEPKVTIIHFYLYSDCLKYCKHFHGVKTQQFTVSLISKLFEQFHVLVLSDKSKSQYNIIINSLVTV